MNIRERRFTYPLLAMLVMLILTSCHRGNEAELLRKAEAFLPAQPDSADSVLRRGSSSQYLHKADRALFGLLRTYTDNRMGNRITSDSLIASSHAYFKRQSSGGETSDSTLLRRYGQCCYYLGLYYSSCDSTRLSEEQFRNAINASERCADWHTCYLAYTQLGLSTQMSNPEQSTDLMQKALSIYNRIKDDPNNEALILTKLAVSYSLRELYDKALECYKKALVIANDNGLRTTYNQVCMSMSGVLDVIGKHKEALNYAKKGAVTADSVVLVSSQIALASCYLSNDSIEQARQILESVVCDSSDFSGQYLVNRYLANVFHKKKAYSTETEYIDSAFSSLEKLYYQAMDVKDNYYQDNVRKELKKEQMQRIHERRTWLFGLIILILSIITISLLCLYKYKQAENRRKRLEELLRLRYEASKQIRKEKEKEWELEQQKIINNTQTIVIRQKNVSLQLMRKYLLDQLIETSYLKDKSQKVSMSEEAWRDLEECLNVTDNNFMKRIRDSFPSLSDDDYHLCMLVRLNIENKVIGSLFQIGESAVKKRKYNLKNRIFTDDYSNSDFGSLIRNF